MKSKCLLQLFMLLFAVSTFAQTGVAAKTPEVIIVDLQLDAYNSRDIDRFVATFSEDIELYDETGKLTTKGHQQLRERYEGFFNNTPNLHCHIENRIIINNKVIDKERVTANERIIEAVAIYEVTGGKIVKVTFVK